MNHPPYQVNSHAEAQAWRACADKASTEELLEALHGCQKWLSVPADACSDALAAQGYVLVGKDPRDVTLEKAPWPRTLPGEQVPAYEGQEGIDWFHEDDVRAGNPAIQLDEEP